MRCWLRTERGFGERSGMLIGVGRRIIELRAERWAYDGT